jgi:1-acyl-sn-glycerol-3-phosphate acyltransferase
MTWLSEEPPPRPVGPIGWVRAVVKGSALGLLTFGGLGVLLLVRLVEAPLHGIHRPWTPYITQFVCRAAFVILGMGYRVTGRRMTEQGAVVSNHASWLDIFTLNARKRVYFVSKSEVAGWPGIRLRAGPGSVGLRARRGRSSSTATDARRRPRPAFSKTA